MKATQKLAQIQWKLEQDAEIEAASILESMGLVSKDCKECKMRRLALNRLVECDTCRDSGIVWVRAK